MKYEKRNFRFPAMENLPVLLLQKLVMTLHFHIQILTPVYEDPPKYI